jgi:hypothetical protein
VFVVGNLVQLLAVTVAFALAGYLAGPLAKWLGSLRTPIITLRRAVQIMAAMARPLLWLLFLWIVILFAAGAHWPHRVLNIAISLLTAWVVIRPRLLARRGIGVDAPHRLGRLDDRRAQHPGPARPTIAVLDAPSFTIGALTYRPTASSRR